VPHKVQREGETDPNIDITGTVIDRGFESGCKSDRRSPDLRRYDPDAGVRILRVVFTKQIDPVVGLKFRTGKSALHPFRAEAVSSRDPEAPDVLGHDYVARLQVVCPASHVLDSGRQHREK